MQRSQIARNQLARRKEPLTILLNWSFISSIDLARCLIGGTPPFFWPCKLSRHIKKTPWPQSASELYRRSDRLTVICGSPQRHEINVGTSKYGRDYKTPKPVHAKWNNASKCNSIDMILLLSRYSNLHHKIYVRHAVLTVYHLSWQSDMFFTTKVVINLIDT
jgi:hypothetical protein